MKKPKTPKPKLVALELALVRMIDRRYCNDPGLRVAHIRAVLKAIDRGLLDLLTGGVPAYADRVRTKRTKRICV